MEFCQSEKVGTLYVTGIMHFDWLLNWVLEMVSPFYAQKHTRQTG